MSKVNHRGTIAHYVYKCSSIKAILIYRMLNSTRLDISNSFLELKTWRCAQKTGHSFHCIFRWKKFFEWGWREDVEFIKEE